MALPKIVQKLFSDEGKGSKLRPDIIPTTINGNSPDSEGNFTPDQTGCLPLSGGTMTGTIQKSGGYLIENTGGALFIANDPSHNYSSFGVYGPTDQTSPNAFIVKASDGENVKYLLAHPDGRLLWGGKDVITSAGGTFTGDVIFDSDVFLRAKSSSLALSLRGGTSTSDGAYLGLYGKDSSEAGMFTIASSNGTNIRRLQGTTEGALTWDGKNVVRSVNNTSADASGNVTISVPTGTVSQKLNTSKSGEGNTTTSITISGLVAYKPVYLCMHVTYGSNISYKFNSGWALNGSGFSSGSSSGNKMSEFDAKVLVGMPTRTSCSIQIKFNGSSSVTTAFNLIAYQ